jgi:hypothetical protein
MTRLRLSRPGIAMVVCATLGVLLVLLALDVRTWHTTIARDDLRFRALPAHRSLWLPQTLLPGDPAAHLLGTSDTIAYRRGLQLFWFSRIGRNSQAQEDLPTLRAQAQNALSALIQSGATAAERSSAANLLGVLVVTNSGDSGNDPQALMGILRRAAGYFQRATAIDPTNVDAEQNLELVLRIRRPGKGRFGKDARGGYGFGKGRGAGLIGSGY